MFDVTSKVKLAVVAAVLIMPFGNAHAAGVSTVGCLSVSSCTLSELFSGGSLTVDDKLFKDFSLGFIAPSSPVPDFTRVTVTGLSGGGLDPGPGLRVDGNGEFNIADVDRMEFGYLFTVSVLDPVMRVKDNTLAMGPYTFTTGTEGARIEVNEAVNDMALNLLAQKQVFADDFLGTSFLSDSRNFAPQSEIRVGTAVYLEGFGAGDRGELSSYTQNFSQVVVPVPAALWLLLSGLAGLGIFSKRRPSAISNVANVV